MKYIITFRKEDESSPVATFDYEGDFHDALNFGNKKRNEVSNKGEPLIMAVTAAYEF